jgi:CRP/FNR family cyclic AMP-dependent transcriptional regulator
VFSETSKRTISTLHKLPVSKVGRPDVSKRLKAHLGWPLPESCVDELLERHMVVNFAASSVIFQQGAPGDVIYVTRAGLVDLIFRDSRERELLVEVAGPGELLGFMDIEANGQDHVQIFTARARTRCEIGVVSRERISHVLDKLTPNLLVTLADHINVWWSEKMERWLQFVRLSARERLASVLAELAEKLGVDDAHGRLIVSEFSHEDFASMIASSRPMVTRLLAEMMAQGSLFRRDRRYILSSAYRKNSRRSIA